MRSNHEGTEESMKSELYSRSSSKKFLQQLLLDLEKASDFFINSNYDFLYTKCLMTEAEIEYRIGNYYQSRKHAIICKANFDNFGFCDLNKEADLLYE